MEVNLACVFCGTVDWAREVGVVVQHGKGFQVKWYLFSDILEVNSSS